MKKLFAALTVLLCIATSAFAQFNFPDAPTANQIVSGPAGQAMKWDGTKWVAQFGTVGGPFLPLAGGTLSGPGNLTVSGTSTLTGTVTFPSGSTATTAGFNNVMAVGIGQAAPTTPAGTLLSVTSTGNYGTNIQLVNKSTGTAAATNLGFTNNNASGGAWLSYAGTGYTASGPEIPSDSLSMNNNGVGGLVFTTNASISPGPGMTFWTGAPQIAYLGPAVGAAAPFAGNLSVVYTGNNYSTGTGDNILYLTGNVNGDVTASIFNLAASGTGTRAVWRLNAGTGNNNFWLMQLGMSNTVSTNGFTPAGSAVVSNDSTLVLASGFGATNGVNIAVQNQGMGRFENAPGRFVGLDLPGYANRFGPGNAGTGLSIGNVYISGTSFATGAFHGASYYDGSQWISDGGGGGGAAMLQLAGSCIAMYNVGSLGGGAVINWTSIGSWCGSGMATDHLSNLTSFRMPTVSSGVLTQDSRDMFGWVTNVTGGQTTITFQEPFISQSNCSLTASGAPYVWFNANQSVSQDTFVCYDPTTGQPCPDGATVEYQCFGQAGENVKSP